jgi:GT2 family glycosyltransferase
VPGVSPDRSIERVSAVVCNYQGELYLEACLRAILAQPGIDQVIVVDDASTDGSVRLVRERFAQVEVHVLARNRGPGAVRNAGMRAARNRWVLAVDNDVVLGAGVLARLRAALAADDGAALAQPRSLVADEPERVHYDGGALHYVGLYSLRNFYRPKARAEGRGVVPSDALIALCALVDREALLGVGGYDEALFYLMEDLDLAARLRLSGWRLLSVEEAEVLHKGGTAGLSFRAGEYPERRAYLHARNRWLVLAKVQSARTLLVAAPGILLYEAVFTAFALVQGQLGAQLRGKRDALVMLGGALDRRRAVQRSRAVRDRDLWVGGPLTISPALLASPAKRACVRALDWALRAWWWIVRPLAG